MIIQNLDDGRDEANYFRSITVTVNIYISSYIERIL